MARCAIGGETITTAYYTDLDGQTYCVAHSTGLLRCYSCNSHVCQSLTGGGVRYADGRTMCTRCRTTAIDTVEAGRRVMQEVWSTLNAHSGVELGDPEGVKLVLGSQDDLARRTTAPYGRAPSGLAYYEYDDSGSVRRKAYSIHILHGLPREHFAAICAHELGHICLFKHNLDLPALHMEGLCELFKYTWLKAQGTPQALRRIRWMAEDDHRIYGQGFRVAWTACEGHTLGDLMRSVRIYRLLPVTCV